MSPTPYTAVVVTIAGQQPQRYQFPESEAHEAAAERYSHYQHALGAFVGSQYADGVTMDRFERGTIQIGNLQK